MGSTHGRLSRAEWMTVTQTLPRQSGERYKQAEMALTLELLAQDARRLVNLVVCGTLANPT